MTTALATEQPEKGVMVLTPDLMALQGESQFVPETFKDIAGTGMNFLPRLQLFTSNSNEVKEMKIDLATYGLVKGKDSLIALGKSVVLIPLAWRAKAMDVKAEPKPLAYFKQESPEFQAIVKAANADSNSGKMYGPEFLVWLSDHGYCTWFFGSKTARNVAPMLKALLPKANGHMQVAVGTAKFIDNGEYKWHGPEISPSAQSLANLPPAETLYATMKEFLDPQDSVEEAPAAPVPEGAAVTDR